MEEQQSNNIRRTAVRTKSNTVALMNELGKIPPQAIDLEQAVLGAMMLDKNAVTDTIDMLQAESFYDPKHVYIYKAIRDLFGTSNPIDLLTVTERLKKNGELEAVGGVVYLSTLTQKVGSIAHIEYHARIIAQKHIQREIIRMCSETLRDAYDETIDVFDLLTKAEGQLFGIAENNMKKSATTMNAAV
ncbi:MAG TPA: DnaB-like helicase N-terminal domain-containing protein, partial [Fluviicola sp.]|nr:DnaB-like helicase N-terminal domain-containing protein [Fluviicola sp.]